MAVLVGTPSISPVVPAGSTVGMLALLVTNAAATPAGWSVVGRDVSWILPFWIEILRTSVYSKVLTSDDLSGPVTQLGAGFEGVVVCYEPGWTVGLVRVGQASVRVGAGARALVVSPEGGAGGGLSWPVALDRTSLPWAPGMTFQTHVGLTTAPAGSAVTLGPSTARTGVAVEVRAPVAPVPPTPSLPKNGAEVPADAPIAFQWVIPGGQVPTGYRLRAQTQDGWRWWNASTSALVASEVDNTSSEPRSSIPGGLLTPVSASRGWQVAWRRADGEWSEYSDVSTLTPTQRPVVTVTGPTGTVAEDLSPTIMFDVAMTRPASVVTAFHVVASQGGVPVHDSGWIPQDLREYTMPPDAGWSQGPVDTLVEVEQTGGLRSAPGAGGFTLTWTPPPTPAILAEPHEDGMLLTVTGLVPGNRVEVERLDAGGWVRIEVREARAAGERWVDATLLRGVQARYRVRQLEVLEGIVLPSGWGMSAFAVSGARGWCYVWDAAAPATTWQRVYLLPRSLDVRYPQVIGKHYVLGHDPARGPFPVARMTRGKARAPEGQVTLRAFSERAVSDLTSLLIEAETIGILLPEERDLDVRGLTAGQVLHVGRGGAVERAVHANSAARTVDLDWITQERTTPVGAVPASPVTNPVQPL